MGESISRLSKHNSLDRYRALELRMAKLLEAEDAVIATSGHHGCFGVMQLLCAEGTHVHIDALSWSVGALADGFADGACGPAPFERTGAKLRRFPHNDMAALRARAREAPGLIVVDGVYIDGSVARLREVCDIADESGSVVVVDETHSFGCAASGLGLCEELRVSHRVHVRTIGFSKALASRGGIVAGPARVIEALRFCDRQMIFSTPPLEYEIVGFDATLDILRREPWRRERLAANHAALRAGLLSAGYGDCVAASERQILQVITGADGPTIAFRDACAARGVHGAVFVPPFAEHGRNFLRFSVHAELSDADLTRFLQVMREVRPLLE